MILQLIGLLLVVSIAWYAISQLTLPPPVRMVVIVVCCIILILWAISAFGLGGSLGSLR